MTPKLMTQMKVVVVAALAMVMTGCGEYVRQGKSPAQVVIRSLQAASGATPDEFGGTLSSDVLTIVERSINGVQQQVPTIFGDVGQVELTLILKDQGQPGSPSAPSAINQITITGYRVVYERADGRNTPGVDVPYPFDGAVTFTIPPEGAATAGFELVRTIAKADAPLRTLVGQFTTISTIATVTFYGKDQAGNAVSAAGRIGISFGDFGDPE